MSEYIERDAAYTLAKKIVDAIDSKEFQRLNFGMRILDWIDDIPAADVRPVVLGKWISKYPLSTCSVCEKSMILCDFANYCPNCGADMREEN